MPCGGPEAFLIGENTAQGGTRRVAYVPDPGQLLQSLISFLKTYSVFQSRLSVLNDPGFWETLLHVLLSFLGMYFLPFFFFLE